MGIDFESFESGAISDAVARRSQQLRANFPDCQLVLGVDRLDYSKGIPERLRAFRDALERYPELRGRVVLIQVVVPSRVEIPRYHEFKQRIDRLVGDINGRFSTATGCRCNIIFEASIGKIFSRTTAAATSRLSPRSRTE